MKNKPFVLFFLLASSIVINIDSSTLSVNIDFYYKNVSSLIEKVT